MPTLHFKGKTFVQNHHLAVKYHQLVPKKELSLTDKVSLHDNLVIQGDNLKALKALLPSYAGKIKCIYIDPPYNTGNEKWVYNDNVNSPMLKEWLGQVVDKEDMTRHDKWLCMMMPRLKLLRELLSEDGVIFISCDDNEVHNLRALMDELYGSEKCIGIITWFKKRKGSYLSKEFVSLTEYIVAYKKNGSKIELFGGKPSSEESQPIVKRTNARKTLSFKKNIVATKLEDGTYQKAEYGSGTSAVKLLNKIIIKDGIITTDFELEGPFTWSQTMLDEELQQGSKVVINTENFQPRVFREYADDHHKGFPSYIDGREFSATTDDAYETLQEIFETERPFEYSKPNTLISFLINGVTFKDKEAVILDSFAGSGTTAHAVLELNKEDGGNRKFILVEQEDYANTITAERVRRVIKGVKTAKNEKLKKGTGGTFSYFQLGDTIEMESLLKGKNLPSFKEFARYLFYTATGEEFNEKAINEKTGFIGESKSYEVYLFYKPDLEWLKKNALTLEICKSLPKFKGKQRLVFAPAKYVDDVTILEHRIDFCQLPYEIYRIQK